MIVLYIPDAGIPHVVPSFAGMIGAHTGMNIKGLALSEMGDASANEAPYQIHAPHFLRSIFAPCSTMEIL